jgi:hypothetical protein
MQYKHALTFPFQDTDWFKKVLIPAISQFIPLVGILVTTGWALEICRRVIRKQTGELPAVQFRHNLSDGLRVWGILLAYGVPVLLWLGLGGLLSAFLWHANDGGGSDSFDLLWWGIEIGALVLALGVAMGAVAAIGRFAESGTFRSALQIREAIAAVRAAPGIYLLAVFAWLPLGFMAVLGIAICGVGAFFTTAYALGSGFHLAGQAHAIAVSRRLPAAVPPAAQQ